ncbi:hypothetical protein Tco_0057504, partial [Tanacetum coccineum]
SKESDDDEPCEMIEDQKSIIPSSGRPTPSPDPLVESFSLSLTPCGDSDILLEETDAFLSLELLNDEIPSDLPPKEHKDDKIKMTKSSIEKLPKIDNETYDLEGEILFLEKLLTDDPSEAEYSKIDSRIRGPSDNFSMVDEEIEFSPLEDIDNPDPIPRVSENHIDSFDSIPNLFNMIITDPLFDSEFTLNSDNLIFVIWYEDSDESKTEAIIDKVHSTVQIPPLFEELTSVKSMQDIILH